MVHRPRVEGGNLVVVQIGGDKGLRGKGARHLAHILAAQAQRVESLMVGPGIVADGCHDERIGFEQLEVVGDVARTTTKLATHVGHQKCHVQDVNLLRENVFLEAIMEHHDGVVGDRTAHENGHGPYR